MADIEKESERKFYRDAFEALQRAAFSASGTQFQNLQEYLTTLQHIYLIQGNAETFLNALDNSPSDISLIEHHAALLSLYDTASVRDGKVAPHEAFIVFMPPKAGSSGFTRSDVLELLAYWMAHLTARSEQEANEICQTLALKSIVDLRLTAMEKRAVTQAFPDPELSKYVLTAEPVDVSSISMLKSTPIDDRPKTDRYESHLLNAGA